MVAVWLERGQDKRMPRRKRNFAAGVPAHLIQRGNNRRRCFSRFRDCRSYLAALNETSAEYEVNMHAYVLMPNHVHLLATPPSNHAISRMMQQLGRKYVSYFNKTHSRTGTLWEGRFRSSTITSVRYLFACYRYIEMNPVRAGLVASPEDFEWSSYRVNALGHTSGLITPHKLLATLGDSAEACQRTYRGLFSGLHGNLDEDIRRACRKGLPLE
jgi:putative transposase